jgi:hypothetical protein
MTEAAQVTLILSAFGLAAVAALLMAGLRMWQEWIELKRSEIARKTRPAGEEKVDIAELRVRVRQLEAIASCVDL